MTFPLSHIYENKTWPQNFYFSLHSHLKACNIPHIHKLFVTHFHDLSFLGKSGWKKQEAQSPKSTDANSAMKKQ